MKTLLAIWPMETPTATPWRPKSGGSLVTKIQAKRLKNTTWKTALKATNPAAYSVSPLASWFQTMTMAMQRARPMMMRPTMYCG